MATDLVDAAFTAKPAMMPSFAAHTDVSAGVADFEQLQYRIIGGRPRGPRIEPRTRPRNKTVRRAVLSPETHHGDRHAAEISSRSENASDATRSLAGLGFFCSMISAAP
jgi:hypothetical protein